MATAFKKGDVVKVNQPVPQGPVLGLRMDDDGQVFYLIEWADGVGNTQQRWFAEDELIGV